MDIGGTKTDLAVIEASDPRSIVRRATYASGDHLDFEQILDLFLARNSAGSSAENLVAAAIGVAGPVRDGRSRVTNLPWDLDQSALSERIGVPVVLVNDLVALAHGLPCLAEDECRPLQAGVADPAGTALLVAVGTGLGVSILAPGSAGERIPLPSEGGHVELAARDDLEARLLARIRADAGRAGRADAERVLSGLGWPNLYFAIRAEDPALAQPQTDAAVRAQGASAVAAAALAGDRLATATLDRWVSWLGSFVGDLALTTLATGGIYLAGGVTQKNAARLQDPAFLAAFHAKGTFSTLLEAIPIRLVQAAEAPLWGAAVVAGRMLA